MQSSIPAYVALLCSKNKHLPWKNRVSVGGGCVGGGGGGGCLFSQSRSRWRLLRLMLTVPLFLIIFFANFKWKKNIKCLNAEKENGKWFSTCCCLKANLNMHELEMDWKSLWFSSDRDISEIENDCDDDFNPGAWWVTMTKVFMMIWVHIGRNRIKLASWSVRHVRD